MNIKFSLRIDDKSHSLTKEDGVPIDLIGELLHSLSKAIEVPESQVVLHEIRGNCYALGFVTNDERSYSNFKIVHQNINANPIHNLTPSEREYAKVINKVIKKHKVFIEALDRDNNRLVKIVKLPEVETKGHIHYTDTIYGTIIVLGSRNEEKLSMVVKTTDGTKPTIHISEEQEDELRKHLEYVYRKADFKMTLKVRSSLIKDDYHYTLESFEIPSRSTLFEELEIVRNENPGIFNHIGNAVDAIREIR